MERRDRAESDFGDTGEAKITILVDNRADLIVDSTETIKPFTDAPLLAEHGFSALVSLPGEGVQILWDAGLSDTALPTNLTRMKIDPAAIGVIALSHGHADHCGAMSAVLRAMALSPTPRTWPPQTAQRDMVKCSSGGSVQIVAHPAAFRERWHREKDGGWHGPHCGPPRAEWEALGAEIVIAEGPYRLARGCWLTGEVNRTSFERSGVPKDVYYRRRDELAPDQAEDDQSIVLNVRGKGLVILTGCAHSGVVNTINHARRISGVDRVWAVIGGYHLARAAAGELDLTIREFKQLDARLLAPTHCTGFGATTRFAGEFPKAFDLCAVGKSYLF